MSFPSALAGPSRIPLQAAASSLRRSAAVAAGSAAQRYASTDSSEGGSDDSSNGPGKPFIPMVSSDDKKLSRRRFGGGFQKWRLSIGKEFEEPEQGAKAKWLGGDVPFPMNPSFSPPPPIGSEFQDKLYAEIVKGDHTLGQISAKYNVSKARLEAIKKLKAVEAEFKRQALPLQEAFRDGMEPLLGVRSFTQQRWGRNEAGAVSGVDEANVAELDEEKRWDAGIGEGGAFGDRSNASAFDGIERTVFEWRSEEVTMAAKRAAKASKNGQVVNDPFPTPAISQKAAKDNKAKKQHEAHVDHPEHIAPGHSATTTFRFVDVTASGIEQAKQVKRAMAKREKLAAKRKVQRERKHGPLKVE